MHSNLETGFPHIISRLTEVWLDGQQARAYLNNLLFHERNREERHGFNDAIWLELNFLNNLLLEEHPPQAAGMATDVWALAADASPAIS